MRTQFLFLAAFVGLILWFAAERSFQREDQVNRRIAALEARMVRAERSRAVMEDAICHEINMRSIRPSGDLSHEQCLRFITEVSRESERAKGTGPELTKILTPTPTHCASLDQWCQVQRWGKALLEVRE
jgi:hypothetical protein